MKNVQNIRLNAVDFLLYNFQSIVDVECKGDCSDCKLTVFRTLLYGYAEIGVIEFSEVFDVLDHVYARDYDGAAEILHSMGGVL